MTTTIAFRDELVLSAELWIQHGVVHDGTQ